MSIRSIRIQQCRIISHAEISPSTNFNLIAGPNGSGKSTFLEAISLLATGRSFRTASIPSIVTSGQSSLTVSATIEHAAGYTIPVGIERGKGCNRLHINHTPARRLSEVAELLPLQTITPDSISLVMGPPRGRRSFLDWGMFHVEPQRLGLIKRYNKTLRQRNALIKQKARSASEMDFWNRELVESGEGITQSREEYLAELIRHYQEEVSTELSLLSELEIKFDYRRGWRSSHTLAEALEQTAGREEMVGHTVVGPHEADLLITSGEGGGKEHSLAWAGQATLDRALFGTTVSPVSTDGKKGGGPGR